MTPRQTCPRPSGFGRNLRSKTRWFTGFCNSHQVSHFATFFIDARAEISVAESRFIDAGGTIRNAGRHRCPGDQRRALLGCGSLTPVAPGFWLSGPGPAPTHRTRPRRCAGRGLRAPWRLRPSAPARDLCQPVHGSRFRFGIDNDPSAGSPTETLLRLLLPLNDKVQWTSRDVAGSEPPTSPRSEHFTGPFNR